MLRDLGHLGLSLGTESIWLLRALQSARTLRGGEKKEGEEKEAEEGARGSGEGRQAGRGSGSRSLGGNSPPIAVGAPAWGGRAALHFPQHQDVLLLLPDCGHLTILLSSGTGEEKRESKLKRNSLKLHFLGLLCTIISLKIWNKLGGWPRISLLDSVQAQVPQTQKA